MTNPSAQSKLKIIKIIDPLMCVRCDKAYIADVIMSDSVRRKMFYCGRMDCDNWISTPNDEQNDVDLDQAA